MPLVILQANYVHLFLNHDLDGITKLSEQQAHTQFPFPQWRSQDVSYRTGLSVLALMWKCYENTQHRRATGGFARIKRGLFKKQHQRSTQTNTGDLLEEALSFCKLNSLYFFHNWKQITFFAFPQTNRKHATNRDLSTTHNIQHPGNTKQPMSHECY